MLYKYKKELDMRLEAKKQTLLRDREKQLSELENKIKEMGDLP